MNNTAWTETDLNVLRSLYPRHGARGVRESLPHKTTAAIRAQAARLGVRSPCPPKEPSETAWSLPMQTLAEQLDCVRLRNWRYPVQPGSLRATLGVCA